MGKMNYPDQLEILYRDRAEKFTNNDYPDEYSESLDGFTALCKEIEAALPKERGHQLTMELESIFGSFASLHQEFGWKTGFKDAFRLSMAVFTESA